MRGIDNWMDSRGQRIPFYDSVRASDRALVHTKWNRAIDTNALISYATEGVAKHSEISILMLHRTPTDYKRFFFLLSDHTKRNHAY